MSQLSPKKDEEKDKKLEDYYQFEKSTDKELEDASKSSYFDRVKSLIPLVKRTQKKIDKIRKQLRKKIKDLEKIAKAKQKEAQKNNPKADMIQEDLVFCKGALSESSVLKTVTQKDLATLKEILKTKEERSFSVITDVALVPLPSDRAKNRQNGNASQQKGKGNQQDGAASGKLTPVQLAALRGTPDKKASTGDDKNPTATNENTPKKVMTAADRDKILAARNGIAPENMGDDNSKQPITPNNIEYSRLPLLSRGRSSR